MAKTLIIYDSKYGNTKLVAEKIAEGINEAGGHETKLERYDENDIETVINYDVILFGSPNHMGGPTRSIKKFIAKLGDLGLLEKKFAAFDTWMGKDNGKAVKKLENEVIKKLPGFKIIVPGLSIQVDGMKGPVSEGEFPKCKEFGKQIAKEL